MEHLLRNLQSPFNYNLSPGRDGDADDFVLMNPWTTDIIDGGSAKQRCAQSCGPGPVIMDLTIASNKVKRVKR